MTLKGGTLVPRSKYQEIADQLRQMGKDYTEAQANHNALVRELDVLLNGAGAAKQASLCDIVAQVRGMIADPEGYVSVLWFDDDPGRPGGALKLHQAADEFPFGKPSVDYDETFTVTTQALIAVGPISKG